MCQRVYAKSCVFASVVAYVHVRGYMWMCAGATVELRSNCAKLRISVGDELRDLQYNCTTLTPRVPPAPRSCRRGRKNYSPVQDMCIRQSRTYVFTMCVTCKRVRMYARMCERTQTNTVTTPGSVGNTYPDAIFTQADRAVIPRAYPPSPSHTSTRIPLGKSRRKSYIASWSNAGCRKWNGFRGDIRIDADD